MNDTPQRKTNAKTVRHPMPLLNTPFVPGHCQEVIDAIEDKDSRDIAQAEYYFFSGQAEKAIAITAGYLTHEDIALRLSACWIHAYANLSTGDIRQSRFAMGEAQNTAANLPEDATDEERALAVCVATGAAVLLHLPLPEHLPPMNDHLHHLPRGLQFFALYVQAHMAYLQQRYGVSIGIVETALALQSTVYPIPTIYLHLVAVMGYMSLKQPERARTHMMEAWNLAKEGGLLEPLGEHHGLVGGMLEAVVKKESPEDFKRIIDITYRFSAGWRKIHNLDTGHDVADNLTTTEFAIAMLAARGWSNKEICVHLGTSENTIKQHISTVFQKLNITKRRELEQFMLR